MAENPNYENVDEESCHHKEVIKNLEKENAKLHRDIIGSELRLKGKSLEDECRRLERENGALRGENPSLLGLEYIRLSKVDKKKRKLLEKIGDLQKETEQQDLEHRSRMETLQTSVGASVAAAVVDGNLLEATTSQHDSSIETVPEPTMTIASVATAIVVETDEETAQLQPESTFETEPKPTMTIETAPQQSANDDSIRLEDNLDNDTMMTNVPPATIEESQNFENMIQASQLLKDLQLTCAGLKDGLALLEILLNNASSTTQIQSGPEKTIGPNNIHRASTSTVASSSALLEVQNILNNDPENVSPSTLGPLLSDNQDVDTLEPAMPESNLNDDSEVNTKYKYVKGPDHSYAKQKID